jgi:glycine hydroxymethyltransferase
MHAGMVNFDAIEELAIERAKRLFGVSYANVQPHSGTQANQAAFFALLEPGDTVLSMALNAGGHLSHGLKSNLSGKWFRIFEYGVREDDGLIDYDEAESVARRERPKLIIAGGSSYPRAIDFERLGAIANEVGAKLLVDIAHVSGLVAAGVYPNPFPHADIVTTTTNKNLRGPRGGLLLADDEKLGRKLNSAVFPGVQGGPLPELIAAKAVCFGEALEPEFTEYATAVLENARCLCDVLAGRGHELVTGGTDSPLVVIDLRPEGLTGDVVEEALEAAGLPCNRNLVPGDTQKPSVTSGLRLGTSAATTRGMRTPAMRIVGQTIANVLHAMSRTGARDARAERDGLERIGRLSADYPLYAEAHFHGGESR